MSHSQSSSRTSRKRALDNDQLPGSSPASTRSLRPNRTPKRSQYFEEETSEDDSASNNDALSGYEEDSVSQSSLTEEEDGEGHSDSDTAPPKKRMKKRVSQQSSNSLANGPKHKDLWRPGVKTGLGPGTQVVIDKPRARSPGKTPYRAEQVHPNTMLFLQDLVKNNDREWLKMHDPDYRTAWKDWTDFLEGLSPKISEADETVPELPLKDCVFRIYRDIRFSPDPTPYKPYFSCAWSRTGRKGPYAAYYVQIKPNGGSFLGGGLWMPEAQALAKLRRDIDRRPNKIRKVLLDPGIRKEFLGGVTADEKKACKAFARHNADSALKTKPRDYDANHQDIELLRLKNFTIGRKIADDEVVSPETINRFSKLFSTLVPFISYLNSVVMPDEGTGSSAGDEGEDSASEQ